MTKIPEAIPNHQLRMISLEKMKLNEPRRMERGCGKWGGKLTRYSIGSQLFRNERMHDMGSNRLELRFHAGERGWRGIGGERG